MRQGMAMATRGWCDVAEARAQQPAATSLPQFLHLGIHGFGVASLHL